MKTSEDILKSKLSNNQWNYLDHVLHSGEVYKQILLGMEEYGKQQYNQAIHDADISATAYIHCGEYPIVDSQSILKLIKP